MLYNAVKSYFYPRSPCGERLFALLCNLLHHDFYPRSPCGERPVLPRMASGEIVISIHALLAESDNLYNATNQTWLLFLSTLSLRRATRVTMDRYMEFIISIHALLAESDYYQDKLPIPPEKFLSTLSLRRATGSWRGPVPD